MRNPNHDMIIDDVRDGLAIVQTDVQIAGARLQTVLATYNSPDNYGQCQDAYDKALAALDRSIDRLAKCRTSVFNAQKMTGKE